MVKPSVNNLIKQTPFTKAALVRLLEASCVYTCILKGDEGWLIPDQNMFMSWKGNQLWCTYVQHNGISWTDKQGNKVELDGK